MGTAFPCFVIFSASLCIVVLQFITHDRLSVHQFITILLPGVSFEIDAQDPNTRYWVIVDTFYYRLQKPSKEIKSERYHWFYARDTSKSTWYLALLISLSFLLSVSFFADMVIYSRRVINSCDTSETNLDEFTCFSRIGLHYVNCSNNTEQRSLQCYKFDFSSASSGLIETAIKAVLLYFTTVYIFKFISIGVRILLQILPSKIWGGVILILGILMLPISISWWLAKILLSSSDVNLTRSFQFFMVSMYFIVSGLFVMQSKWWLKITPAENRRVELMTLQHWKSCKNPNTPFHSLTNTELISTVDTPICVHINDSALVELENAMPESNSTFGDTVEIHSERNEVETHALTEEPQESRNAEI